MDKNTSFDKRELIFLLIIAGINLILRALYIWQYSGGEYWGNLTVDARYHYIWAQAIASGDFWGHEVFFRAPFYAYFLALIHKIFSGSITAIVIVQNLIGCFSLVLTCFLARRVFGKTAALITAILYLFTFDFYFFESELLLDFLLVFFLPLFFLLVYKAESSGKRYLWLISGLILGLAAATRPTVLILILIIPLAFMKPSSKLFKWKKWARNHAFLIIGTAAILLPIAVRNYAVGDDFTAIPSQGGINFYIGNNPQATGWSAAMPDSLGGAFWEYADCKQTAEIESGRKLNPSGVSSFWMKKGLVSLADSPGQALSLYWRKIRLLISNEEISNNRNIPQFRKQIHISAIMRFSWWLFLPFGLVGMIFGLRQNYQAKTLAVFILVYSASILLFFITSRFRLPLLPFWIIFAAMGLQSCKKLITDRNHLKGAGALLVILTAMLFSLFGIRGTDFTNPKQELYSSGNRLLEAGQYKAAIDKFHELLGSNPGYPQANMNLAFAFVKSGELDSAEYYYQRELEVNRDSALTLSSLAEIKRLTGNYHQAYDYALKAFQLKPHFIEILVNYVRTAREYGRASEALALIKPVEDSYLNNPYYYYYRGVLEIDLAQADLSLLDSARNDFQESIELFENPNQPDYDRDPSTYFRLLSPDKKDNMMALAWANIGIINLNRGINTAAHKAFSRALHYNSDLNQARQGLLEACMRTGDYNEALVLTDSLLNKADNESKKTILLYRAQALYNLGKKEQSRECLEGIINEYPDFEPAHRILEAIKTGGY